MSSITTAQVLKSLPIVSVSCEAKKTDAVIIPYTSKEMVVKIAATNPNESQVPVKLLPETAGETFTVQGSPAVIYLCISENEKKFEKKIAKAIAALPKSIKSVSVDLTSFFELFDKVHFDFQRCVADIMVESRIKWNLKSKGNEKVDQTPVEVTIVTTERHTQQELKQATALGKVQAWVQSLVAMPSNYLTPTKFLEEVEQFHRSMPATTMKKVTLKLHDEAWVKEKKMGSFLSVSQGSRQPLTFIEMSFNGGNKDEAPYVFVGKGVTFDTGGISLKQSKGMHEMKGDMAGAASACASLFFAALAGLPLNVVTLAPCCENMPDGNAIKPGDVVTAMNGKTIEITNTDAEGRLILADALVYAQEFKGKYTIDMATLTGACITALGYEYTGMFTDNQELSEKLVQAGKTSSDWVWPLPMDSELHKSMLTSSVADMSNSAEGAGGAGATNGAIFLKEFAPESGWVHLDIAGVSEVRGSAAPTGRPVPMIAQFLVNETM